MGDKISKIRSISNYRMEKAKEDLETARITFEHNKLAQSTNRSYYAVFHALRSLLAYDKFDSKRHSSIIGYFNKAYIANSKIAHVYYKIIARAFDIKTKSDYQDFYIVSRKEAEDQLKNATVFVQMIDEYIENNFYNSIKPIVSQEIKITDRISLIEADITTLRVDAIVNAANESLLGGGGVDGQIHRVAGAGLLEECRKLKGCPTGQAKITSGYNLPAKWVIHTPGPIWQGGHQQEDMLLAGCYRNSLKLAVEHHVKTIAFPMISTGVYKFPLARAFNIAIREIKQFLEVDSTIDQVYMVLYRKSPAEVVKLLKL